MPNDAAGNALLPASGLPRPIWRGLFSALVVFVANLVVAILLGIVFSLLHLSPGILLALFLVNLLMLAALLGIYKIFCVLFEDKPLASVGLAFRGRWKAELALGLVMGAAMILAVAGLEGVWGLAHFTWIPPDDSSGHNVLLWAFFSLGLFTVAGTSEELTFRGYPFQRLIEALGPAGAVGVFSALFGLAHLNNTSHTWISTFNTMLVGATFAIAYLRTRSLWLPVGMHIAWNITQGYALGFPVSGIMLPAALCRPDLHGAEWLTGGSYGPEGSLLTTGVIVLGTVFLLLSKSIYVSKEMRELISPPLASSPLPPEGENLSAPGDGREA